MHLYRAAHGVRDGGQVWWLNCGFLVSLVYVDLEMPKCLWLIRWRLLEVANALVHIILVSPVVLWGVLYHFDSYVMV